MPFIHQGHHTEHSSTTRSSSAVSFDADHAAPDHALVRRTCSSMHGPRWRLAHVHLQLGDLRILSFVSHTSLRETRAPTPLHAHAGLCLRPRNNTLETHAHCPRGRRTTGTPAPPTSSPFFFFLFSSQFFLFHLATGRSTHAGSPAASPSPTPSTSPPCGRTTTTSPSTAFFARVVGSFFTPSASLLSSPKICSQANCN